MLLANPEDQFIIAGQSVTLACSAEGDPKPVCCLFSATLDRSLSNDAHCNSLVIHTYRRGDSYMYTIHTYHNSTGGVPPMP